MQTGLNIKFNNKYHVELIDSTTGALKQSGDFHNTHLIGFYQLLIGKRGYADTESTWDSHYFDMCKYLKVGSGTTAPTFNDTKLATELWSTSASNVVHTWINDYTIRKTATFTFPATSSYVGSVREVGMEYVYYNYYHSVERNYGGLSTRALLTDSEGQIITFEKTDLDILVITVNAEVSFTSSSDGFKIVKQSKFLGRLVGLNEPTWSNNWNKFIGHNGYLNLIRFRDTYENITGTLEDKAVSNGSPTVVSKLTADEAYLKYSVARLPSTDITEQTFYHAVSLPSIGYWPLPNEDIFPAYKIEGINIGTGDGTTTSFENPLSYFKKDSEKIYKNGVLLTRGVDYTINHISNKDCKPELAQMIPPKAVRSDAKDLGVYTASLRPLIIPSTVYKSIKDYDLSTEAPAFNAEYPLYIEYEEPVTMNCLKWSNNLRGFNTSGSAQNVSAGTTFYLDYSLNGEEYIEVGSVSLATSNGSFTIDFTATTAKYWRVRTNWSANSLYFIGILSSYNEYFTLNHKDPYIVFTEAPASGDTLTMDVDMDIIMKSENYVVDLSCRIDFKI